MPTVFLNGRFLTQPMTGVQRFAVEVVQAIDSLLDSERCSHKFVLLTPRGARAELHLKHIQVKEYGRLPGVLWEQFELPYGARSGALLNLGSTGPALHRHQIVTMHDASVFRIPDNFSIGFRIWYKLLLPFLGRHADAILTVSEFSKSELASCAGIRPEKIDVVHNAASHITRSPADNDIIESLGLQSCNYILCVGATIANKNLSLVVEAMRHLDQTSMPIVTFGQADDSVFAQEQQCRSETNIVPAGVVTDAQLRALYENAYCFVFPSLYEGFGIPPVEAMLCRCPTIVADTGALPETCGSAALYCDPYDARDLASKIQRLISDPTLRTQLIEKASCHVRHYSWEKCATRIVKTVDRVVSPSRH